MSSIKGELHSRIIRRKIHDDKYGIVGVEIKNRRKIKSQTLEALSLNVCSKSYLCKIEKNKIDPNKAFLREICSRLELSDDKVDFLFDLRDVVIQTIKAFIVDDENYIAYAVEHGRGFKNYRYTIIKFIHYLSIKDLSAASRIHRELLKIITNMSDFDLNIFALFSSILSLYKFEFKNALDDIEYMDVYGMDNNIEVLKKIVDFEIRYAMNTYDAPMYYMELKRILFDIGYYPLINKMEYLLGIFFIRNSCDYSLEALMDKMSDKKLYESLKCFNAFMNNDVVTLADCNDSYLNEFALAIKKIVMQDEKAIMYVKANKRDYYRLDYDQEFLDYLLLENASRRYDFIINDGIPKASSRGDGFLEKFYIYELTRMPKICRNRSLFRAHRMVNTFKVEIGDYDEERYEE